MCYNIQASLWVHLICLEGRGELSEERTQRRVAFLFKLRGLTPLLSLYVECVRANRIREDEKERMDEREHSLFFIRKMLTLYLLLFGGLYII